jgi:adenylate cyclase
MLMKLKGVQVVSRTSAFQLKQQSLDVREIGRQRNASYVLEGSFRISGSRIRISANFINVGDGFQIGSDRFDRDMNDVFAVQDEIAQTIAGALELDDSIAEAHSAIGLVAAIHDFDWATAESRFQKALTLAPDNATARYWYAMFVLLPNSRFEEALGQARWAADLDPVNPGICAATGLIYYMRGEHDRALEELDAALELEPTHPLSNIIAAYASIASGRPDEALLKLKHCQSMRVVATGARAWAMLVSNKRAAAEELLDELKQMS